MREPTHTMCKECEESKPYEGGEVDIADHFDSDSIYQYVEVFICADCLATHETTYQEPAGDGQLYE